MALQGIHPLLTLPCPAALRGGTKQNIGETVRSNREAETTIEQRCLTPHPAVPRSIAGWRNTKYRGGGRRTEGLINRGDRKTATATNRGYHTLPLCSCKEYRGSARRARGLKTRYKPTDEGQFSTPPSKKGECHSCTPLPYLQVYRIKNSTIDREIGSYFRISLWQELSPSFSNFKI